jgi:hypothetical protein
MNARASIRTLPDGRVHLQDGPIDLVVEASGADDQVAVAYGAAGERFVTILDELCGELPLLRSQAIEGDRVPQGIVARRMWDAVLPFARDAFITPMAAVAGAVAEEVLGAMTRTAGLGRAYVNNGGDIAFHLAPDECFQVGLVDRPDRPSLLGTLRIASQDPVRGIATSGWRGRSFSLGIADAVTVLAATAAQADAAATMIANSVDLPGHPALTRRPANDLDPQSDLGVRSVTVAVGTLSAREVETALQSGLAAAQSYLSRGLISAAALHLDGQTVQTGIARIAHAAA